ncbi:hypothetical protein ACFYVL_31965 [Streptomyces sp. NPDC004111]|uniref:hypothetical protein n=1 Tax=Streptomyces sp. NPDC004111 TaxID=3364690 RepID=UPI00367B4EE0
MIRQRSKIRWLRSRRGLRGMLAGAAALCAVSGQAGQAGQALAAGTPAPYAFDKAAQPVKGTAGTADAPALAAGATYRDSIKPKSKQYYRLDLDATTNSYVSAVAVPRTGTKVGIGDDLKVSVLDRDSSSCDLGDNVTFGSAEYPRPLSTYGARLIDKGSSSCQKAGTYYVLVERGSGAKSSQEDWDLEIRHQSEPGLRSAGPTAAPSTWPSTSPDPPTGGPQNRKGGTGFNDATGLTAGEWRDGIKPGESLFYRVPVDWGQQIFSDVDLHSAPGGKNGFVGSALSFALYNPARGFVKGSDFSYDGKQKTAAMDPLPPVKYENRFTSRSGDGDMQLAGWYYLRVTLSPQVGTTFGNAAYGMTLRVNVTGTKEPGPAYAGAASDFGVSDDDREAAANGQSVPQAERSGTMKTVAAAGIGAGTVLVLGLGVWTLVARRRAAGPVPSHPAQVRQTQPLQQGVPQQAVPQPGVPQQQGQGQQPPQQAQGYGPPSAW